MIGYIWSHAPPWYSSNSHLIYCVKVLMHLNKNATTLTPSGLNQNRSLFTISFQCTGIEEPYMKKDKCGGAENSLPTETVTVTKLYLCTWITRQRLAPQHCYSWLLVRGSNCIQLYLAAGSLGYN